MKQAAMATFSLIPSPFQPVPGIKPQGGPSNLPAPFKRDEWKIVGDSAEMKRLRLQIRRIGPHFRAVLISGERGAGKELVAHAMHQESVKDDGPFVAAASGNRIAYLMKVAQCGTLFFKGIDDMPLETQDELLAVLRKNEWAQDGLAAPQKLGTRIIASTKQDLRGLAASGLFRQELWQRIAMVQIALPPLRKRMEDVPLLAAHLLGQFAQKQRENLTITKEAMDLLKSHCWPGNVEELEHVLGDAALQSQDGVLHAWHINISATPSKAPQDMAFVESWTEATRLQDVVNRHVLRVLNHCAGNKLRAAELLGISRSTLYRMLDTCAPGLCISERD